MPDGKNCKEASMAGGMCPRERVVGDEDSEEERECTYSSSREGRQMN